MVLEMPTFSLLYNFLFGTIPLESLQIILRNLRFNLLKTERIESPSIHLSLLLFVIKLEQTTVCNRQINTTFCM